MAYCPNCGTRVSDDSLFCTECGTKLSKVEGSIPQQEPQRINRVQTPPPIYNQKSSGSALKIIVPIALGAFLIGSIIVGAVWYFQSHQRIENTNSEVISEEKTLISMHYGGKIGEGNCYEFEMDGTSGYYLLIPEEEGGTKRTLSLESFNSSNGECIINAYLKGDYIGKFDGKVTDIEKKEGHYICRRFAGDFISVKGTRLELTLSFDISAGLTFRTFTEKETMNGNDGKPYNVQSALERKKTVTNLKQLGFKLVDSKTERRPDYTGEDYETVTIETYSKVVNGNKTTVILEEDYTKIYFPNLQDVEEFKQSAIKCGLRDKGDTLEDIPQIYWDGTNVDISGTTVTLQYRWEA